MNTAPSVGASGASGGGRRTSGGNGLPNQALLPWYLAERGRVDDGLSSKSWDELAAKWFGLFVDPYFTDKHKPIPRILVEGDGQAAGNWVASIPASGDGALKAGQVPPGGTDSTIST